MEEGNRQEKNRPAESCKNSRATESVGHNPRLSQKAVTRGHLLHSDSYLEQRLAPCHLSQ